MQYYLYHYFHKNLFTDQVVLQDKFMYTVLDITTKILDKLGFSKRFLQSKHTCSLIDRVAIRYNIS